MRTDDRRLNEINRLFNRLTYTNAQNVQDAREYCLREPLQALIDDIEIMIKEDVQLEDYIDENFKGQESVFEFELDCLIGSLQEGVRVQVLRSERKLLQFAGIWLDRINYDCGHLKQDLIDTAWFYVSTQTEEAAEALGTAWYEWITNTK